MKLVEPVSQSLSLKIGCGCSGLGAFANLSGVGTSDENAIRAVLEKKHA